VAIVGISKMGEEQINIILTGAFPKKRLANIFILGPFNGIWLYELILTPF
jgi:hypothetical protein